MKTTVKIDPGEYIFSALPSAARLDAAFKVAREAFRNNSLTLTDVEKAVKKIRKRIRHAGK